MRNSTLWYFAMSLLLMACEPEGICSADALTTALSSAAPGEVIQLGACTVDGSFTVPMGVTLRGHGARSVLRSGSDASLPVVVIEGIEGARLESLAIRVEHGGRGARLRGADAVMDAVLVDVARGIGVTADASSLRLERVELRGPVTEEGALLAPSSPSETGVYGLAALGGDITLHDCRAQGFAELAISVQGGTLTWTDDDDAVDVHSTRVAGIALFDTSASLEGVELGHTLASLRSPGVAIALVGGEATLRQTRIGTGAGYGIVSEDTALALDTVTIEDTGLVGVQVQRGTLDASDVRIRGAGGIGLAVIDATVVRVDGGTFEAQRVVSLPADLASASFGDGVLLRRLDAGPPLDVSLTDVALLANPRAGLLVDAAGTAPTQLALVRVRASASDERALGAVTQRTTVPDGWDEGVMREGFAAPNDDGFAGELDLVGLVMPPVMPPPP